MGMSYAMWNARHRDAKPYVDEYPKVGVIEAYINSTLAGVDVSIYYRFVDGRLYEIEVVRLYRAYFDKVFEALKDKYGEPTTRTHGELPERLWREISGRCSLLVEFDFYDPVSASVLASRICHLSSSFILSFLRL